MLLMDADVWADDDSVFVDGSILVHGLKPAEAARVRSWARARISRGDDFADLVSQLRGSNDTSDASGMLEAEADGSVEALHETVVALRDTILAGELDAHLDGLIEAEALGKGRVTLIDALRARRAAVYQSAELDRPLVELEERLGAGDLDDVIDDLEARERVGRDRIGAYALFEHRRDRVRTVAVLDGSVDALVAFLETHDGSWLEDLRVAERAGKNRKTALAALGG